ncbi:FAD-dependent oxidoreductase [Siphonobacter sp.]|uniref:FAD-dependent oxidoreductase n=1 Tax=Siphonobacter sp. TaxID=1869184 RepID=UPI003B3BCCAB
MTIQGKTIAIVGGGPGGLTLARLLQLQGAQVKVYERDVNEKARVQGATLDLHEESGLEALRQAGLMEAFWANYRPNAGKLRVVDAKGTIYWDDHAQDSYQEDRPEIDRGPLRNLLLDSLQPGTVVWDRQLMTMRPRQEGWELTFQNGTSVQADLVIGADGARSRIRPFLTEITPFYSGITVLEGGVPNAETASPSIYKLLKGGKIFALGNSQSLIVSSKGDGSMSFYAGFRTEEDWVRTSRIDFTQKDQVLAWFQSEFAAWDNRWSELFTQAETPFIPRPQYCMPLDQTWEAQPNLTLLGDAAHLMPPYAGEGVNMAMADALELNQCLTNPAYTTTVEAIAAYEQQMRFRASQVARATLESTEMMHAPGALEALVAVFQG